MRRGTRVAGQTGDTCWGMSVIGRANTWVLFQRHQNKYQMFS